MEMVDGKHQTVIDPEHYDPIATSTPSSIPQIRREFTSTFLNGARYLEAAGKIFDQPTHHARKIMELSELYEVDVLDQLIGIAIDEGKLDIKSFKAMLKDYNCGNRTLDRKLGSSAENQNGNQLTRDCSYYEEYAKEINYAGSNREARIHS